MRKGKTAEAAGGDLDLGPVFPNLRALILAVPLGARPGRARRTNSQYCQLCPEASTDGWGTVGTQGPAGRQTALCKELEAVAMDTMGRK
jgi:hypothetical protein